MHYLMSILAVAHVYMAYTVKSIRISTDILWRVFHILTESGPLNSVDLRTQAYTELVPLKYGTRH